METDELIRRLAADAAQRDHPVQPLRSQLRQTLLGAGTSVVLVAAIGWGVRPDLLTSLATAAGLAKFGLLLSIVAASFALVSRSAEPGREVFVPSGILLGALTLLVSVLSQTSLERSAILRPGNVPIECLVSIFVLAALPLAALLSVLRTGAPTRPWLTGLLAGLLAGGVAALGFALYCPMDRIADVMTWYPLAIGIVGITGALAGARVLAW